MFQRASEILNANDYLAVLIPASGNALVFRVKSVANPGWQRFRYGYLPGLTTSASLSSFSGGTVSPPAANVMPSQGYFSAGQFFTPLSGMSTFDANDMWYTDESFRNLLFHVYHYYTPKWLRVDVQIPTKTSQSGFQEQRAVGGLDQTFGFGYSRGMAETVHLPLVKYGWRWGNDTNMAVFSSVVFVYGEYFVSIPRNADLIFDILTKKYTAGGVRYVTLPMASYPSDIQTALKRTYGIEGFKIPRIDQRQAATQAYTELFGQIKEGV